MFIGRLKPIFLNPEGIVCQNARNLHTIPSGLRQTIVYFSINIHSLREFKTSALCDIKPIISYFFTVQTLLKGFLGKKPNVLSFKKLAKAKCIQ